MKVQITAFTLLCCLIFAITASAAGSDNQLRSDDISYQYLAKFLTKLDINFDVNLKPQQPITRMDAALLLQKVLANLGSQQRAYGEQLLSPGEIQDLNSLVQEYAQELSELGIVLEQSNVGVLKAYEGKLNQELNKLSIVSTFRTRSFFYGYQGQIDLDQYNRLTQKVDSEGLPLRMGYKPGVYNLHFYPGYDLQYEPIIMDNIKITAGMTMQIPFFYGWAPWIETSKFYLKVEKGNGIFTLGDYQLKLTPFTLKSQTEVSEFRSRLFTNKLVVESKRNQTLNGVWPFKGIKYEYGEEANKLFAFLATDKVDGFLRYYGGMKLQDSWLSRTKGVLNFVGYKDDKSLGGNLKDSAANYVASFEAESELTQGITGKLEVANSIYIGSLHYAPRVLSGDASRFSLDFTGDKNKVTLSYRDVSPTYYARTAQGRTIISDGSFNNDIHSDLTFYQYYPWQNAVAPYGDATPNRKGFELEFVRNNDKSNVTFAYMNLKEKAYKQQQGVFTRINLGQRTSLALKYLKPFVISLGVKRETASGDKLVENLNKLLVKTYDLGIEYPLLDRLSLLAGYTRIDVTKTRNELESNQKWDYCGTGVEYKLDATTIVGIDYKVYRDDQGTVAQQAQLNLNHDF